MFVIFSRVWSIRVDFSYLGCGLVQTQFGSCEEWAWYGARQTLWKLENQYSHFLEKFAKDLA
jgi:hypothetical protein